jgi:hypothetical protein
MFNKAFPRSKTRVVSLVVGLLFFAGALFFLYQVYTSDETLEILSVELRVTPFEDTLLHVDHPDFEPENYFAVFVDIHAHNAAWSNRIGWSVELTEDFADTVPLRRMDELRPSAWHHPDREGSFAWAYRLSRHSAQMARVGFYIFERHEDYTDEQLLELVREQTVTLTLVNHTGNHRDSRRYFVYEISLHDAPAVHGSILEEHHLRWLEEQD